MHKVFEYTYLSIFFYYTFVANAFTHDNRTYLEHVFLCKTHFVERYIITIFDYNRPT